MQARRAILALLVLFFSLSVAQQPTDSEVDDPEFLVGFDPSRIYTEQIPYLAGSASLQGYVAYDNSTATPRPAVIILPDWDGIGPYEEWRAHQLATLGYTALVADIFGADVQQGPALAMPDRQALTRTYLSDQEAFVARIHAALDTVRSLDTVDPDRLAAIGYCFGGAGTILLHRSYPNNTEGLLGVAGFHSGLPQTLPELAPNNPIRALYFNGFNDQGSSPERIADFEASLNATNASWALVQFGQTVHAFTEPSSDIIATNVVPSNSGYNPIADRLSWWTLRGWLRDIFGQADASNPYTEAVMPAEELTTS